MCGSGDKARNERKEGMSTSAREEPQRDSGRLLAPRTSGALGDLLGQQEGNQVCEVVWTEKTGFCLTLDDAEAALVLLGFPPGAEQGVPSTSP